MDKLAAIGFTTVSTQEQSIELARSLVSSKLAKCVQISSPMTSIYEWDDKIQNEQEFRLTLKFTPEKAQSIEDFLKKNHPYEVFQWLWFDVTGGSQAYIRWLYE